MKICNALRQKSTINIIAEIGWNHMGNMNLDKETISSINESFLIIQNSKSCR